MNNLKRVLSTVLAGTMLAGMMVVGASAADFSDADKIEHTDAVNTLVALNVINGKDDGSYDPEGIVTRAEMAKMIATAMNGGEAPTLGVKTVPTYSDIKGHWAESYIEYCSSLGIIGGRGDGTFDPNGTVTGVEAAKMMLVAMGWDSTIFNFTGADWAINVAVEANKVNLFEELEDINPSLGLTRDNTAQLIFNGILAPNMVKSPSMEITNGSITWGYELDKGTTIYKEKFGGQEADGVLTFTSSCYDSEKDEYTYTVAGDKYTTATDYTDLFRQSVRVLYKETKTGTSVYGIFAKGGSVVVEGLIGDIADVETLKSNASKVKVNGVEYTVDGNVGKIGGAYAFASSKLSTYDEIGALEGYKAFSFQGIDTDNNGKVDTLVYFPFTVGKVAFVGKDSFKLDGETAKKYTAVDVYDDIAKDDWVKVTAAANTADKTAVYEKIDTVISGKVSATKNGDVKIDGEWYTPVKPLSIKDSEETALTISHTYEDMPVVNGYIFAAASKTSTVSVDDYAVLIKAEGTATGLNDYRQGILLLTDGKKVTVDLKDDYTEIIGKLVTFDVDDDVYTLAEVDKTEKGAFGGVITGAYKYVKDGKSTIDDVVIADDAIIFIAKNADAATISSAKVITGAELKKNNDGEISTVVAYTTKNSSTGFDTVSMAYISGSVASSSDYLYGYVTDVLETINDDDETILDITLWTADGETSVTTTAKVAEDVIDDIAAGDIVAYKLNGSGKVSEIVIGATKTAVTAYDGTNIKFSAKALKETYKITDDTVIIYVNSADKTGVEGGTISLADKNSSENYIKNVAVIVNGSTKDVTLLVVDDNNAMK